MDPVALSAAGAGEISMASKLKLPVVLIVEDKSLLLIGIGSA